MFSKAEYVFQNSRLYFCRVTTNLILQDSITRSRARASDSVCVCVLNVTAGGPSEMLLLTAPWIKDT
jgi:hypothetical protein